MSADFPPSIGWVPGVGKDRAICPREIHAGVARQGGFAIDSDAHIFADWWVEGGVVGRVGFCIIQRSFRDNKLRQINHGDLLVLSGYDSALI